MKRISLILAYTAIHFVVSAQVCVNIVKTRKVGDIATFSFTLLPNGSTTVTDYTIYVLPTIGSRDATVIALQSGANTITLPYNMGETPVNLQDANTTFVDFRLTSVLGEGSTVLNNTTVIDVTLCNASIVLPIELLDFKATPSVSGNLLAWTTAHEVNSRGFEVERRQEKGSSWDKLGFVNAQNKAFKYEFLDSDPANISYYRLKMAENDGTFSYSKTISIERDKGLSVKVYPNPTHSELTIELNSAAQKLEIELTDVLGRVVFRQNTEGANLLTVNMLKWQSGIYILKVSDKQKVIQQKIIKQ